VLREERVKRLLGHLRQLEELTGRPLKTAPERLSDITTCPILQFAPPYDSQGRKFHHGGCTGVRYDDHYYDFFSWSDSIWWGSLRDSSCRWYLKRLVQELQKEKLDE